ncbi:DUF6624 domain-containing protein [Streptomyces sp. NPDC002746]
MNRDLAAELHRRAEQDQTARRRMLETGGGRDLVRIDADNTAWLKQAIATHGWPGITLVAADEPQVYGTQYTNGPDGKLRLYPVAEPEQLDARRAAMGLESAAEYHRRMRGRDTEAD